MNQMRTKRIGVAALLFAGAFAGCAGKTEEPSKSLVRARVMEQTVAQTRTPQLAPAEVHEAKRLLANAEKEHQAKPQSNLEKHLANLAFAKFEIAMAEARRRGAETELAMGRPATGDHQAALDAEHEARMKAEQEARTALERLREVASIRESDEGTVITLTGAVLFESDHSELLPIAEERLEQVAEALEEQEGKGAIVIEGHADAQGPVPYNEELSMRRAIAVKQFLIDHGVSPDRIRTVGRGEKEPIATNKTPEGRANNRRVEIILEDEA